MFASIHSGWASAITVSGRCSIGIPSFALMHVRFTGFAATLS
jgi:hypothetical protein